MTRIAIRDSTDSYNIGFLDNTNGIKYHSADLEVYAQGSAFLDLKYYSKTQIVDVGMRLAFDFRGKDYWMTVTSVSRESEYEYQVEARSLSLEALREVRSSYKASRNMTFKEYIDAFDPEHSIRLNVNTIADRSRQLEWTGEDTILARILSLATKFDAEIAFETELNDDYSLKEFRLNVHALNELGKDRTGTPFRISNSQLKLIKFKSSIDEFYSAIRGTGKDGLSISGLDKKVYDDEKKLLFYTSGGTIYAPQARDKFISITNKKTSDGYIVREFDNTEHETKEVLYAYMLGELKKHCEPQIDYTIDGYIDADVNDKVLLIDDKYTTDDLMLTARVNKQKWSLIDKLQDNNRTELSNYVRVYSEIDERLLKIMDDLVDQKTPYVADILTSNGSQFVNKIGKTTLTPSVVKGLENATGLTFEWFKDGEKIANTTNVEVSVNDFDNKAVYKYIAYLNNKKVAEKEITLSNVSDGEKGEQGATGNGVSSTVVNYGVSTSGTTQPTSWSSSIPSVPSGQFLWTRTVMNYTNGSSTTFFSVAKMGETGARGSMGIAYLQPTAPTGDIETGSTWFKTVSTTDKRITSIYHYLSGSWVQNQFTQDAINVNSLSALSATLGNVTAGTITGSVFTNDFNRSYTSTLNRTGTTTLSDGKLRIDYKNVHKSTGATSADGSYMEYSESGISFAENDGTATGKRLELNSNRLALGSSSGALYADPTTVELSGNGYFQLQPKYFLGSSGDTNYQKLSWTVDGFELRPVDIYGNARSGNTGIEIAGNNSYVDFKVPYNNGGDYDTRIILFSDKSFQIENVTPGQPITFKTYNNLRVFTDNSLVVRSRLDTSWKPVYASGFSQQSDKKWKYNIKDMPSRLEQFKNLNFKAYRLWSESGKYQEGIIANDNIELPFISKGYDGYAVDSYAYATFIGKATQEYIAQTDNTINELKNENVELKTKITDLESEIESIKQQLSTLLNK